MCIFIKPFLIVKYSMKCVCHLQKFRVEILFLFTLFFVLAMLLLIY
jgi:hypothetical protein